MAEALHNMSKALVQKRKDASNAPLDTQNSAAIDHNLKRMHAKGFVGVVPINVGLAFLVAFTMRDYGTSGPVNPWLLTMFCIAAARVLLYYSMRLGYDLILNSKLNIVLSFVQGSCWAMVPFLFGFPATMYQVCLLTIFLGGLSAGAILTQIANTQAWLAFTLPVLCSLFVYNFVNGIEGAQALNLYVLGFYLMIGIVAARLKTFLVLSEKYQFSLKKKNAEIATKNKSLFDLAHYDGLTGTANRKLLHTLADDYLSSLDGSDKTAAFFHIDLDHFKHLNDTMGHAAGDEVLSIVAARLKNCVRENDIVARLGGDEFGIFMTAVDDPRVTEQVAAKIINALNTPKKVQNSLLICKASIGIAFFPRHGETLSELMHNSDLALQSAKKLGRGRYKVCTNDLQLKATRLLTVESELKSALKNRKIGYHFQPILRAADSQVVGAEALMRFVPGQLPDGETVVTPHELISVAETVGLMDDLSAMLFESLEQQGPELFKALPSLEKISINLSPLELRSQTPVTRLRDMFNRGTLAAHQIQVEITEQSVLDRGADRAWQSIRELSTMGISLVMDDFGTGYSSLTHLKTLPIDGVKIDKSFVSELVKDMRDAAIVRSLIGMCKGLGIKVTAEGVENISQFETLKRLGCDYVQGYLFFKAESVEQLKASMAAEGPVLKNRFLGTDS